MEDLFNSITDNYSGGFNSPLAQNGMIDPLQNACGIIYELFPGSWFTDAQQHFGLSDSEIAQSVKDASAFFHMDNPLFIHEYRNTGVFTNLPFTDKDDVLVFNRDQMQNMGITEKDGFDLVMTHEGTHRMLQGSSYHLSPHQEELCCDFMSGVRAGLNNMDITQVENALSDQPEGTAHPVGSLRVEAIHEGQQYAEQYMAETGHAPTFEDCYGHFCDSFSESHHNAGLFSEDTDMLHEYSSAVSSADAEVRRCQSKVNSLYSEMQSVKSKYGTNSNEYKHVKSAYDKAQSALKEAREDYKQAMQNAIRTGTL